MFSTSTLRAVHRVLVSPLKRHVFLLSTALCFGAGALRAQGGGHDGATLRVGTLRFPEEAALRQAVMAGVGSRSVWMAVQVPRPFRGVAVASSWTLDVALPTTDGRQFPLVPVDAGDTTRFTARAQRVALVQGATSLLLGASLLGGRLFGETGIGAYSLWLAQHGSERARLRVRPLGTAGAGYDREITSSLAVRAAVRWLRYVDFDRGVLDATTGLPADQRVTDALTPPPTSRGPTVRELSLSMRYRPGGAR